MKFLIRNLAFTLLFTFVLTPAQTTDSYDKRIKDAIELMNNQKHTESLEILTQVETISKKNNWHLQQF